MRGRRRQNPRWRAHLEEKKVRWDRHRLVIFMEGFWRQLYKGNNKENGVGIFPRPAIKANRGFEEVSDTKPKGILIRS